MEILRHNIAVNRTPGKLRLPVPSALRAPVAGYLQRYAPTTVAPHMSSHILRISLLFVIVLLVGHAHAGQDIKAELTKTPWQFGLVGKARSWPVGLAFQKGVTAAVLRLLPDGQARSEIPCRNEEFIKKIGEEVIYIGTWELRAENELTYTVSFRGHPQTESGRVEINGDELRLIQSNGNVRRAERFFGNVQEPCRYE